VVSRQLEGILQELRHFHPKKTPFQLIKNIQLYELTGILKRHGIGCYNTKAKGICQIVNSGINLHTCSIKDLECFHGIGPKTARCFIIHSRKDAQCAGLDTHVLKFLGVLGYDVPKSTPTGKLYESLEQAFLKQAKRAMMPIYELDLSVWRYYSGNSTPEDVKLVSKLTKNVSI